MNHQTILSVGNINIILKLQNDATFSTPRILPCCIISILKYKSNSIPHIKCIIKKRLLLIIFLFEVLIYIKNRWWCHKNLFLFKVCNYFLFVFFHFSLFSWIYSFLLYFCPYIDVYERHGWTCSLVCIHDENKIMIFWEILYVTNNIPRMFLNLARKNIWRKKTIWSENDSAYMIFLVYGYACYIKTSILLNPSILWLWYHLHKAKGQKLKNITRKDIKFPFAWCSWVFDLTPYSWDTTIVNFTNDSFPSVDYDRTFSAIVQDVIVILLHGKSVMMKPK